MKKKMKDPAFLFYSDSFMTGILFMSDEQVGKYIRLLCAQHSIGHLTEEQMLNICKQHDEIIWEKFRQDSSKKFYNERLEMEIDKRRSYVKSRSNNRKGRINKVKDDKNISRPYDQHMEDIIINKDINEIIDGIENKKEWKNILIKWALYRIEIGKPLQASSIKGALKRLKELSGDNVKHAMTIVKDSIDNGYQGLFPAQVSKHKQSKTITEQWLS